MPKGRRRAATELCHWAYGAVGGAAFGALPDDVRRSRWAGPAYGLATWLVFELAVAPALKEPVKEVGTPGCGRQRFAGSAAAP